MSITITSLVVAVIGFALDKLGVKVGSDDIGNFVNVFLQIVGALGIWWGRVRQGDVKWYGAKK